MTTVPRKRQLPSSAPHDPDAFTCTCCIPPGSNLCTIIAPSCTAARQAGSRRGAGARRRRRKAPSRCVGYNRSLQQDRVAMPYREIIDDGGVWVVFSTQPWSGANVRPRYASGWLSFHRGVERRRLSPIPSGWEAAEDTQLRLWLRESEVVAKATEDGEALGGSAAAEGVRLDARDGTAAPGTEPEGVPRPAEPPAVVPDAPRSRSTHSEQRGAHPRPAERHPRRHPLSGRGMPKEALRRARRHPDALHPERERRRRSLGAAASPVPPPLMLASSCGRLHVRGVEHQQHVRARAVLERAGADEVRAVAGNAELDGAVGGLH
jgi:hypothetical protein